MQMLNPNFEIETSYSEQNQTLLLYFSIRTAMFAIMTWPGMEKKFSARIDQKVKSILMSVESWEL